MKTIKETHPSLKFKQINISFDIESFNGKWNTEEHLTRSVYRELDIQEHTIDKVKVKKDLKEFIKSININIIGDMSEADEIEKKAKEIFGEEILFGEKE